MIKISVIFYHAGYTDFMYSITICYYDELNFFLAADQKNSDIHFVFSGRRSVKDLIESMGVPHVEVDLILVNGKPADFSYIVNDDDKISVYPESESSGISGVTGLRLSPLIETRFVLDVHLRKLARNMRLLGFDADYADGRDDPVLAEISARENRILLTCDRQLLMRKIVSRGIIIRSRDPDVQIIEVIERLHLHNFISPFIRCIECNGILESINMLSPEFNKEGSEIPEGVLSWCKEFFRCTSCRRIYWKGSHYDRLSLKIEKIMKRFGDYPKALQ